MTLCDGCQKEIGPQDTRILAFEAAFEGDEIADEPMLAFENPTAREYHRKRDAAEGGISPCDEGAAAFGVRRPQAQKTPRILSGTSTVAGKAAGGYGLLTGLVELVPDFPIA